MLGESWALLIKQLCSDGAGQIMLASERKEFDGILRGARETTTFAYAMQQLLVTIPSEKNVTLRKGLVSNFKKEFKVGEKDQLIDLGDALTQRFKALAEGKVFAAWSPPAAAGEPSLEGTAVAA